MLALDKQSNTIPATPGLSLTPRRVNLASFFEKVIKKLEPDFNSIYNKMDNLEDTIFTRLTGSGSCIFSVFENKLKAENAKNSFLKTYPNLWVAVAENNNIKL